MGWLLFSSRIFFFKQKTAYEISACLVGSEMCIRDRIILSVIILAFYAFFEFTSVIICFNKSIKYEKIGLFELFKICLLYTSDAADEEDSVDLGGRRVTEKKKHKKPD
ncbi:hypothetical protein CDFC105_93857 [Clostridioides difficile]|nr:hypothetical protein CDFC105_93857 [Clostridioides difficile]